MSLQMDFGGLLACVMLLFSFSLFPDPGGESLPNLMNPLFWLLSLVSVRCQNRRPLTLNFPT